MTSPLITLTTDFQTCDSYVAQMKGALYSINPGARLVDVTHGIPPQDVARAARVLEEIAAVFPAGTIHVVVVDPGVGSDRPLLAVEWCGQRLLVPDNGLVTRLVRRAPVARVHRLAERRFWRETVSNTFHGRDILAPVAAWWSLGTPVEEFGPIWECALVMLQISEPQVSSAEVRGEVETIDSFGNLVTNLSRQHLPGGGSTPVVIEIGDLRITRLSACYADGYPGEILALLGSGGKLEIAVNSGNAARQLSLPIGSRVHVSPVPAEVSPAPVSQKL